MTYADPKEMLHRMTLRDSKGKNFYYFSRILLPVISNVSRHSRLLLLCFHSAATDLEDNGGPSSQ
jgi:hypothetical protein